MSYLVIAFVLYLVYKWVVSFRNLLAERGWMEETTQMKELKEKQNIQEANKMLY